MKKIDNIIRLIDSMHPQVKLSFWQKKYLKILFKVKEMKNNDKV